MATKHTPGPWRIHQFGPYDVIGDQPGYGPMVVANCGGSNSNVTDLSEVKAANTHLIVAAPDMGEALCETTAALVAAISLLERAGKSAKKAAPSDTMFDQMLTDYCAAAERGRVALIKAGY
jgi:hypothetical protein